MSAQIETTVEVPFQRSEARNPKAAGTGRDTDPPEHSPRHVPTGDEIEAILARLYKGMRELNRKLRLEGLTRGEEASLEEVKLEIDRWEVLQRDLAGKPEIQNRLEDLTHRVIAAVSGKKI